GNTLQIKEASQTLYETYKHLKQYKDALEMFELYVQTKDTLNSKENRKALQTMELKYQYEKEQAIKEQEHQKQLAIQQKEKERQKVISYAVTTGLILVLAFSIVIFNRLQITNKQKKIIEKQKQVVEEQKKLVEEKNKEITDSIVYAKRIQDAILPSDAKWQTLLPNSFVLYLPKDIIAGDFYWLEETEDYIFVAAADCTGHGVPGAMVSVVCSNALTKTVLEEKIYSTDKILHRTREIVVEKLSASEKQIQDGMDVALIRISKKDRRTIQFSGANRPLFVLSQSGIQEIQGDKQPVGLYDNETPFTCTELFIQKGDELILFTDGFGDQFGGEKGKKLGSKRFRELVAGIAHLSCDEQKEYLKEFFTQWKRGEDQTDDITVIGIRW
ncbi:MAG: serine/threonine-protein phosphatase, partial [Bacteroidetes bacterium]